MIQRTAGSWQRTLLREGGLASIGFGAVGVFAGVRDGDMEWLAFGVLCIALGLGSLAVARNWQWLRQALGAPHVCDLPLGKGVLGSVIMCRECGATWAGDEVFDEDSEEEFTGWTRL